MIRNVSDVVASVGSVCTWYSTTRTGMWVARRGSATLSNWIRVRLRAGWLVISDR